jgi:hypothetical protein
VKSQQKDVKDASKTKKLASPTEIIDYTSAQNNDPLTKNFELNQPNYDQNEEFANGLQCFIDEQELDGITVLSGDLLEIILYLRKTEILRTTKGLLFGNTLIKIEELEALLKDFEDLNFTDCNAYRVLISFAKAHY